MARIRSLHPGQWTDEAFVSCSPAARLLALGLRNEADDQGIFEWKPLTLKMRLFPADPVEITELLAELVASGQIRRFDQGERCYGVIRNFRKWQRPEKPKASHPLPPWGPAYIGLAPTSPPEVGPPEVGPPEVGLPEAGAPEVGSTPSAIADRSATAQRSSAQRKEEGDQRDKQGESGGNDRPGRARSLPAGWTPDSALRAWTLDRLPGYPIAQECEKFVNYWMAKGGRLADWAAAWRNWVLRDAERGAGPPRPAMTSGRAATRTSLRLADALALERLAPWPAAEAGPPLLILPAPAGRSGQELDHEG